MSTYFWTSTSSQDPLLGANWTKSDGTTGTAPDTGDDIYIQAVAGLSLANIWASGGVLTAPSTPTTSGASSTGGNLAQSTNYFYKITALSASGESLPSGELSYTTPASGTATNQITLNWSAVTGATGYKIYRSTSAGAEKFLASVGAVTSYADTSATVPAGPMPGSAVFSSLTINQSFTGTIGNAGIAGYWRLGGATTWTIGVPAGNGINPGGSGRIKIDFGSSTMTGTVLNTSSSSTDSPSEPVRIVNANASSVLNVLQGRVGLATNQPGDTSTVLTVNVVGKSAYLNMGSGVTWTNANVASGGTLTSYSGGASTVLDVAASSEAILYGTTKVGTITNSGTVEHNVRPAAGAASDTINNYDGGNVDFSGNPATGTITTLNAYSGSQINVDPANPGHMTFSTINKLNVGTISYD